MKRLFFVAVLIFSDHAFAESQAEAAFAQAALWTVLVRGSLETPFIEDEQGAWTGSGFVVDAKRGWVVTNAHVSSHSPAHLSVTFRGGKALNATPIYVDPYLDLAVLQFDPKGAPKVRAEARLACDAMPPTGHPVGAFGHPWGYQFTGTRGITSAITSRFGPDMIQTDAPINSGNSGGALISLNTGAVVGVNTEKAARKSKQAEGISFAVPMPHVCTVLKLLKAGRDPSPPGPHVQFAIDLGDEPSLVIARVNLPNDAIPLHVGDTIIAAAGKSVATEGELFNALRGRLESAEITVKRDKTLMKLNGRWPAARDILARQGLLVAGALFAESYMAVEELADRGPFLMVHHVDPGSEAESLEIAPYDLLLSVNGARVLTLATLQERVDRAAAAGEDLDLVLMRSSAENSLFAYHRRTLSSHPSERISVRVGIQGSVVLR
jgi:serine protease Do